jgi:hypothetical protein
MTAPSQSPAKCEVGSVVRFPNAKRERPVEIHKQLVAVYGNFMNGQNVTKWYLEFSEGRTDVYEQQRNGKSSLISYGHLQENAREIRANRRLTIREMHHIFPGVSKTTILKYIICSTVFMFVFISQISYHRK